MDEVHQWLDEETKHDAVLRAIVRSSNKEQAVYLPGAAIERVYHRDAIRAMCVKYQLRFLDAGLFKGELPDQAVHSIRQLERQAGIPITSFKMMAPAARFKLSDSEVDPLLFVPLGDDRYYLVHKWGNDLGWRRVVAGWAFRSPMHLCIAVLTLSLMVSAVMPAHLISNDPGTAFWGAHRLLFFFWISAVCASFTVFSWFAFFGQFSTDAWNSKYFNA